MKKWNLIIDVDNCTNCNMCTLASKDEHVGNAFPGYSAEMPKRGAEWIKIEKKERGQTPMIDIGYIPTMCQHCDDAPCMKVAKNNAITKRNDIYKITRKLELSKTNIIGFIILDESN